MIPQKRAMVFVTAIASLLMRPDLAAAAPWSRGFVVDTYGYAFHYGGQRSSTETDPGVDCPHGSTVFFSNEDQMRRTLEQQPWRSKLEIDNILNPPGIEKTRVPVYARFYIWGRAASYRGWRKGIETYVNPSAAPDPGQPEVTGRIADGFDLDSDPKTGGFVSTGGQRGIDNSLYRAWGCDAPFRNPVSATMDLRENNEMRDGLFTVVIRISGNQDPLNDKNATLEIGYSPDKIVKDAGNNVARGYSFRIVKSAQYTKLKATITNGVVETEQVSELHVPQPAWFYDQTGDADFHKGRIRLTIDADGSATGLMGGYRDVRDLYAQDTFAQTGALQGVRDHEDHVSLYYALKRNADGMPDPRTGVKWGISTAYRLHAVPTFVIDPATPAQIVPSAAEEPRKKGFEKVKAAFVKAVTTNTIQEVPLGTGEGQFPAMEKTIADLPSKEFFLKTLDAPGRLDAQGHVLPLKPAPKPQASSAVLSTVASASKP